MSLARCSSSEHTGVKAIWIVPASHNRGTWSAYRTRPCLPSKLRAILAMRLLWSSRTLSRGRRGKPSRRTMALSDRSMLSNWSCSTETMGISTKQALKALT